MNCERTFRLSDIIAGLSHALDLTEGQPPGHAQRTCLIGLTLAAPVRLDEDDTAALFYALLLKDAGCSSNAARMTALFGGDDRELKRRSKTVDWTRPSEALRFTAANVAPGESPLGRARAFLSAAADLAAQGREMIDARCDRGARIVSMLGFPPAAAEAVRTLDERWDGRGLPARLKGDQIPLLGRIASLSQAVEVFFTEGGIEAAREMVRARRGSWFDPQLADLLLAIGDADPLWSRLAVETGPVLADADAPDDRTLAADDDRLDQMARAFAQVIDAKSPFTARHSSEVARYAGLIARRLGYDATGVRDLHRAGLLHDIGKLGISNSILDKPAGLTDEEVRAVREHPRHTAEILSRVEPFAPLAAAAAAHHERRDGRGYHLGLAGEQIPPAARILAVADVYEALTANRPYRAAMSPEEALSLMARERGTAFFEEPLEALGWVVLGGVAERDEGEHELPAAA